MAVFLTAACFDLLIETKNKLMWLIVCHTDKPNLRYQTSIQSVSVAPEVLLDPTGGQTLPC